MKRNVMSIVAPLALIAVGIGWLLTTWGIGKGIDWIWTIALASVGALVLATHGLDKLSVVVGPFFLIASGLSVLRQTGRLAVDTEVPVLVITVGALWLLSLAPIIPVPKWYIEPKMERPEGS